MLGSKTGLLAAFSYKPLITLDRNIRNIAKKLVSTLSRHTMYQANSERDPSLEYHVKSRRHNCRKSKRVP